MIRALGIGGVVLSGRRLLARRPAEAPRPAPAAPPSRPAKDEEMVPGYYDEADRFHPLM